MGPTILANPKVHRRLQKAVTNSSYFPSFEVKTSAVFIQISPLQSRSQEFESRGAGEMLDKCTDKMLVISDWKMLRKNQSYPNREQEKFEIR